MHWLACCFSLKEKLGWQLGTLGTWDARAEVVAGKGSGEAWHGRVSLPLLLVEARRNFVLIPFLPLLVLTRVGTITQNE